MGSLLRRRPPLMSVLSVASAFVLTLIVHRQFVARDWLFTEERIRELIGSDVNPCATGNQTQLRRAYINVVSKFHCTDADHKIEAEQARRQKQLKDYCNAHPLPRTVKGLPKWQQTVLLKHLHVNERHKFVYCSVPKVACTHWKQVLKTLNEQEAWPGCSTFNHLKDTAGMRLYSYPREDRSRILKTYYRFLFVRNPLERLLSAYLNKLHPNGSDTDYFNQRFGQNIVRMLRPGQNPEIRQRKDFVTWPEFAEYLLKIELKDFNEHWMPYEHLCQPCALQYNFIGHYENLNSESNYVIRKVQAGGRVAFPDSQTRRSMSARKRKVLAHLHTLRQPLQDGLINIFAHSHGLFGYDIPEM